jgi:lipopolysaccharide export system protein LptA
MPFSLPPTPPALVETIPNNIPESPFQIEASEKEVKLLTQERGGSDREFIIPIPTETPEKEPKPNTNLENNTPSNTIEVPLDSLSVVEIVADRQEYDDRNQIITASGNVVMRFNEAILVTDRIQINLKDRLAVAQGKVTLTRGEQILRGDRFEYYFALDRGTVYNANGEIYQSSIERDTGANIVKKSGNDSLSSQLLNERLSINQPLQRVTTAEGINFTIGSDRTFNPVNTDEDEKSGGNINRLRFEAEKLDFDGNIWSATNLSLTNDPFSPPELEFRADSVQFRKISTLEDELNADNARIVVDGDTTLPLLLDSYTFDRRSRSPLLFKIGYDGEDRGGLFVEKPFDIVTTDRFNWTISPQYFIQRAIFDEDPIDASVFGFKTDLNYNIATRTDLDGKLSVTSFDTDEINDNMRAQVVLNQKIGVLDNPYNLSLEYKYRERIFNGSLRFQDLQSSFGVVLTSPDITIGDTGIELNYQASIHNINAATDRPDLLVGNDDDIINLTRYQAAINIGKEFLLWTGDTLPPTPEEGLRYTATPVQPYLQLFTGITGVTSMYSNGDRQDSLRGTIGLEGQFGHSADDTFDYTGFNISYSQSIRTDESPFKFDRFVDEQTISAGIVQQIYGPFRIGFQTTYNLNNGEEITTDYYLEYSRRTFNVIVRYNPILELGSFSFRISDFNWNGSPENFEESDVQSVIQGVESF